MPAPDFRLYEAELKALSPRWLHGEVFARECPQGTALFSRHGAVTYLELHERANRLAHALRAQGLRPGDALALMCSNRPEFVEVFLGAMRAGLRVTPVSTQLNAEESRFIIDDCDARLLFVEDGLSGSAGASCPVVRIATPQYAAFLQGRPSHALADGGEGSVMLYTSGTTGRPKGVRRPRPELFEPQFGGTIANYGPDDVQLCVGPAYHSAPLLIDIRWPLVSGVPIVLMDQWDAEQVLAAIETHRVSCAHMVPTMFRRLLALPEAVRRRYALGSLRHVVHGAAPCSVDLKRAMMDWLGPVLWEYYGATEGGAGISVSAQDWLARPGTVGRLHPHLGHRIVDDAGRTLPPGQPGRIWLNEGGPASFCYHKDPAKTEDAFSLGGGLLLGDEGYVDAEGWLFLTGRSAEVIISGGVNVYPTEVDDTLRRHPWVADAACVGAPDAEWGERVVALVVPAAGAPADPAALAEALRAHAQAELAGYKRPRDYEFLAELPYSATGKVQRRQLRERFWQDRARQI